MTNFVITLKWVLLVITLTGVCADDTHGIEKRDTNSDSKKIVCYYTNWSVYRPGTAKFTPQNINPYLCTHLIYAFGGLDKENGLRPYDKYQDIEQGGYAKFTGLKTYNKNLKTMLAIGGWNEGSSRFSNLVADEDRRATFVKNVVKFLRQNNFDGLDLDWEYPAFRDGSKPADKENYAALVKELREEFEKEASKTGRPRLLLTMAVPAGIEYIDKGYDIPKLNKYLDFMNILSYDYHSAYEPNVNHHSPLYSLQEESEYNFDAQLTIDYTVQHYLKKGADPEKLVLGIPTYGRSYTLFNSESTDLGSPADGPGEQGEATREKGYLAYYEICSNVAANDEWKVVQTKKSAMGPYAYRGNQWVGYDDTDIVKVKANYVNEKGLGGIMFWSIDNDDFRGKCHGKQYPLIETGKEAMLASSGVSTKTLNTASTEEKRIKLGTRKQRPKHHTTTGKPQSTTTKSTTTTTSLNPLSTPEPPTTPDPGTDFVCKEEGFFPHPRDCKKYFWCLDSGPSNLGIVAHQFTCPSGLLFNKAADSCDYSRNVICNKKDKSTTTTTVKTTSGSLNVKQSTVAPTTTTTTTTTETPSSEIEYEEQEDVESEEDPKAIKQLITLIKKLGGINELEKQLKLADGAKEVTTPAISKNLYNKVFSNPTAARFRYQHRNAPAGQQNEDPSSNEDVPYRKEKPQYVTIQRSRPLKNIAQDTEDSGTANAKAIQPSRNTEEDYEDIIPEEEMTTTKYSSLSRSRMATDSRPSTLKYVVLERNRPDKSTTDEGESTSESSLPSTQKYITLIRNRTNNSITTSGDFSESRTESGSPQHTSRSSTQANEPLTEKSREKVSEIETTTANTLPVTSAQNVTAKTSNTNTTDSNSTSNSPNTYLVFAQKVTDENQFKKTDDQVDFTPKPDEMEISTESITTSIATTIITTFRESATEKTRIPLRMYREFLKQNRTDDLATNIFDESKRQNNSSTTMKLKNTTDVTVRKTPINLRRTSLNNLPTEVTTVKSFPHFRSSGRRNKTHYTTTSDLSSEVTSRGSDISRGDIQPTTHRYYRFRTISTESNADIDNFFKKRRSSTTQKSESKSNKTSNYFSDTAPKYVFGNKPTENVTTIDNLLPSTYRNRFSKYRSQHRTTLDLDNVYGRVQETSTASVSDQLSEPNSNEKMEVYLKSQSNDQTIKRSKTATEESNSNKNVSTTTTGSFLKNHFRHRLYLTTDNLLRATVAQPTLSTTLVTLYNFRNKIPQTRRNNSVSVEKEDTEIITTTISSSSTDHFQITHDRGNNTADPEAADVHHVSNVFAGNASMHTLDIIKNDSKTEAKSPTIKHRLSAENGTVLPNMYSSSTEGNVQYTVPHGTTRFLSNENFNKNKILTEMAYSPATEESQLNFYDRYSENKYKPEHSETRGEPVHSKTNSRNNSRFLKSPESENKRHSKDKDKVIDPYNYITEKSPLKDSPVYIVQKTNENQIEFEVRIRHQTDKPSSKQESAKRLSPSHEEYQTRGKKKFADSLKDANNLHTEYTTENKASKTDKSILEGRHAQVYYSSPVATESSRYVTTFNPRILNRGSIKAKNSLSKAEIKELVDLDGPKSKPVNKIEETYYNSSPTIKNNFTPKEKIKEMFIESTDNFGFSKIYVIPNDFSDRFYDEATDQLNEAKEEFIAVSKYKDVNLNDVFRVSETKYSDEGTRHTYSVGEKSTPEKNHHKLSANTANMELPTRLRSNFRRNNQIQRTRFTQPTTTTTTTTEYSDVSKLSSRFRRRKVRPENRSINTARNENFLPLTEIETSTLTRHKNYDISHRGTSLVSDYLPIPAPFFQENQTHHDELITDNINSQDLQIQSISPPKSNNNNDDISDLADPAVAAIAHLKTLPPASSQITFSRAPIQSLITYTNEPLGQYNKIKSTFRTTTAVPINEKKISYRRGPSKLLARTTTTTQLPSLQDIYNDYHDTDAEYHADPVDIPISGKVRIHSDGYIECLDMGNFPHPFSCRKFISCAKMEYDSLLGWEYTCPKGLSFDPIGGICNWAAGLGCKD